MPYTKYPHPADKNLHGDSALPTFPQLDGSAIEWVDDIVTDRTVAGTAKTRSMYPAKKRGFRVLHRVLQADIVAFETFYDSFRKTTFDFVWAGNLTTYQCKFEGPPRLTWINMRIEVESRVVQV